MKKLFSNKIYVYLMLSFCTMVGFSLSFGIYSNYFKEVFEVTPSMRGLIEIPRESPGVFMFLIISSLSFMNDMKTRMLAQILMIMGISIMAFVNINYSTMLLIVFVASLGQHISFNTSTAIELSLSGEENVGKNFGKFRGAGSGFSMIGFAVVYLGFKSGLFNFGSSPILPFAIAVILFILALLLVIRLNQIHTMKTTKEAFNFVIRKEYTIYYILVILYGIQKQVLIVYGPWVLIEILQKGADTLALITLVGSFIGMFFIPYIGNLIDRLGIKKGMYIDAFSFIFVYLSYGFLVYGFINGSIPSSGIFVILAYTLVIIDKMSGQIGVVRTLYLKKVLVKDTDLSSTVSLGMTLDHILSITSAVVSGFIWTKFGPHYVFFTMAFLSLVNLVIAMYVND